MGLNLLYANDRAGAYPQSWYAATAEAPGPYPAVEGEVTADVAVVGAGFTGLSSALHLAERGLKVVLIEAHRVGFGASGRNGGQLGTGQRVDQMTLEKLVGRDDARKLWALAEGSKDLVKTLVAKHDIPCHLKPGIAHLCYTQDEVDEEHAHADYLAEHYDYPHLEKLDRSATQAVCPSPRYIGGSLDMQAGHVHPLALAFGLARAAEAAGAKIFETTEVYDIDPGARVRIRTSGGTVWADHAILACNGYLGGLNPQVGARVMPINNFIAATEPLGDDAARVLAQDVAVADTKFVLNYFRLSHDKRLLFGGGETYRYRFPSDIAELVRRPMSKVFPHLKDVKIDYAWGGTLAITMRRLPYLTRLSPTILSASGYSGHGVGMATFSGKLLADAIAGEAEGFDTMARIPTLPFPGGTTFRSPVLMLAMTWFALRDRLGV